MNDEPTHVIDRHIIKVLTYAKAARYRDLRPENTDSNLFNYHRKMMIKDGYIRRNAEGLYELSEKGLRFAERASVETMRIRARPKLQVTFLLLNKKGEIAVWQKVVQPFIGTVNLPNGKVRFEDENILESARRLLAKFYVDDSTSLQFRGVAEVTVSRSETLLSHAYRMVVVGLVNPKHITNDLIEWVRPNALLKRDTTPGVIEIVRDYLGAEYFQYTNYRIVI